MEQRIKKIYDTYREKINPLIVAYEVLENKFPIGIFNEIRAIFSHLAKAAELKGADKRKQIDKAEGHTTRLERDCYKYNCVALEKKYCEFFEVLNAHEHTNELSSLILKHDEAITELFTARTLESAIDSDKRDKEIYQHYSVAYNIYLEMINTLRTLIGQQ